MEGRGKRRGGRRSMTLANACGPSTCDRPQCVAAKRVATGWLRNGLPVRRRRRRPACPLRCLWCGARWPSEQSALPVQVPNPWERCAGDACALASTVCSAQRTPHEANTFAHNPRMLASTTCHAMTARTERMSPVSLRLHDPGGNCAIPLLSDIPCCILEDAPATAVESRRAPTSQAMSVRLGVNTQQHRRSMR